MIRSDNYRNDYVLTNSLRSGRSLEAEIEQLRALNATVDNMAINGAIQDLDSFRHQYRVYSPDSRNGQALTLNQIPSLDNISPRRSTKKIDSNKHGASTVSRDFSRTDLKVTQHSLFSSSNEPAPIIKIQEVSGKLQDIDMNSTLNI